MLIARAKQDAALNKKIFVVRLCTRAWSITYYVEGDEQDRPRTDVHIDEAKNSNLHGLSILLIGPIRLCSMTGEDCWLV